MSNLEAFARNCIAADRYPDDTHRFERFSCAACGGTDFKVTVEHHTGSVAKNFKGIVWGQCATCGSRKRLFTFTGKHREPLREETPVCKCGNRRFSVGMCERIEGEQGLAGFFDEGVIVGQCSRCSRKAAFVYTD